ncbi:MAG TPA: kelch repeat-containing protein [Planctomycetota bacterium]
MERSSSFCWRCCFSPSPVLLFSPFCKPNSIAQRIILAVAFISSGCAAEWAKIDEGQTGERAGSVLLYAPDLKQMLLIGNATGAPMVQAFDLATQKWQEVSAATPSKDAIHPYYQAAYNPVSKAVYCLSGGSVMYVFDVAAKNWKTLPAADELDGMGWRAMACDPLKQRLVVVGCDKKAGNIGWMRTLVYDIPSAKWARIEVADENVRREHQERVAGVEATIDLVGHLRLAWFRDPKGIGTDEELRALNERCAALKKMAQMDSFSPDVDAISVLVQNKQTLSALQAARSLQRKIEEAAEAHYPVPTSRRNSPLVFDEKNKLFVLVGGDHEDYLMNDTWILDLEKQAWKRAKPETAPSPRAGHALCFLPKSGRIALYEGYVQSTNTDYGSGTWTTLDPVQIWLYDVSANRWQASGSWPIPKTATASNPGPVGMFYGYAADKFSPPALAADSDDRLLLARQASKDESSKWNRISQTWALKLDAAPDNIPGAPPNQRLYRGGQFSAAFCEVPDAPKDTGLDALPENQWVKLPAAPRNPCKGCRQRDWGTCVWDSDRSQVLLWGGGHCVRSASTVAHYSPVSGRIVEGFDADEPYGRNGGGGYDSSVWNRPWVSTHNYNHYAYDPKCKLLVSGRGYLYDPERMDWLRIEPLPVPYRFSWGSCVVEGSANGAVAWAAQKKNSDEAGLWLFDKTTGWQNLEPKGKLFVPYCDSSGMVYDSKRDRMILSGVGGGYNKVSNGTFLSFDFKSKQLSTLTPANSDSAKTRNAREMAYVEHADCVLIGDLLTIGDKKTGKHYTRIYDCEHNKMLLLDAGSVTDGYSAGWMYDAQRRLVYAFNVFGEAWALKLNLAAGVMKEQP